MKPKYVVCPGFVTSKSDGQTHYVDAPQLMRLYGVDPNECEVYQPQSWWPPSYYRHAEEIHEGLIKLVPRYDGNYQLPACGGVVSRIPRGGIDQMISAIPLESRPKQPYPNHNWCVGCTPDNCAGCGTEPAERRKNPSGLKDHQIAQLVSELANELHGRWPNLPEMLRQVISGVVCGYLRKSNLKIDGRRDDRDSGS